MTKPDVPPPPLDTTTTEAEARRWWSIMAADRNVADNLAAFSAWIEADARHRDAFEQICRHHHQAAARRWRLPAWIQHGYRRWITRTSGALAAAALAGLVLMAQPWHRPPIVVPAGQWENRAPGDGSTLQFGPGTQAWVEFSDRQRTIRLAAGSVIVDAAKDPSRPMIVATEHGSIRVVGTRFTVIVDATATELSVSRGKVEAVAASQPPDAAPVTASQAVRLSAAGLTRHAAAVADPEEIRSGWRTFTAAPLADLAAALARESGQRVIALPSAAERAGPVSGRFFVRDTDATIALLQDAYALRRAQAPFGITILY